MNNLGNTGTVVFYILVSFVLALLQGPILIPLLHRFKFGQNIREEGPRSHFKKAGTPTMGGLIFIIAAALAMAIKIGSFTDKSMIALYALVAFGIIGLLDDSLKIIKKKNEGLTSLQKMILILGVSILLALYGAYHEEIGTSIIFPFVKNPVDIGLIGYVILIVVYFASVTNGVNLTDGLDGLATSVSLLVVTFFSLVALGLHEINLAIFCGILLGALLGFLKYNAYPAKVFMGDTGSLAIGGAIGAVAMILKMPIFVIIVGGIYVFETLSVIIQVISFKSTGKRVFKMAPVHHHFEALGWHETRVVAIFSITTVILCLLGFLGLIYVF
ncbi:MAG: phospho-N-acetylmuramoyl-pentapeptide-transferase [Clostridiaceae bacterium]